MYEYVETQHSNYKHQRDAHKGVYKQCRERCKQRARETGEPWHGGAHALVALAGRERFLLGLAFSGVSILAVSALSLFSMSWSAQTVLGVGWIGGGIPAASRAATFLACRAAISSSVGLTPQTFFALRLERNGNRQRFDSQPSEPICSLTTPDRTHFLTAGTSPSASPSLTSTSFLAALALSLSFFSFRASRFFKFLACLASRRTSRLARPSAAALALSAAFFWADERRSASAVAASSSCVGAAAGAEVEVEGAGAGAGAARFAMLASRRATRETASRGRCEGSNSSDLTWATKRACRRR